MRKSHKGNLSQYVRRIMLEKNLSRRDVKLRSDGQITDSYVSGIVNGTATNLSIEKVKALARGLRVSERELVEVAYGLSYADSDETENEQSHNLIVLDLRNKTIIGTDIAEIIEKLLKLPPSARTIVLRFVRALHSTGRGTQPKRKAGDVRQDPRRFSHGLS